MRLIKLALAAGVLALALTPIESSVAARAPGPNGQIAFSRLDPATGNTFLYVANPDGSHLRQLSRRPSEAPHWSPDGGELAVLGPGPAGEGDRAAIVINVDSRRVRDLIMPDPTLFTACPVWSPDGTRLFCEGLSDLDPARNGIYSIDARDGSNLRRVTAITGGDDIPGDFSPDGRHLVFSRTTADGDVGLFTARVDGSDLRRITPPGTLLNFEDAGSWSPLGNVILFQARSAPDQRYTIWEVRADGTGLRSLPVAGCGGARSDPGSRGCLGPVWSPDGSKIVFTRLTLLTSKSMSDTYIVNADSSGLTPVTRDGRAGQVDWGTRPLSP